MEEKAHEKMAVPLVPGPLQLFLLLSLSPSGEIDALFPC